MWGLTEEDLETVETAEGRPIALVRVYHTFGDSLVGSRELGLVQQGRALLLSVAPVTSAGAPVSLSDIAAGRYDSYLGPQLDVYDRIASTPYFIFDHEPNNSRHAAACSSPSACGSEFVQAWQHVHQLAVGRGDTRLVWVWTLSDYTYRNEAARVESFYPGAAFIDAIGVDVYPSTCDAHGGSETFASLLESPVAWRQMFAPATPMMVPEWGAPSATDSLRANFLAGVRSALEQPEFSPIDALAYYNSDFNSRCPWRLDVSAPSFAQWSAIAKDPYFGLRSA